MGEKVKGKLQWMEQKKKNGQCSIDGMLSKKFKKKKYLKNKPKNLVYFFKWKLEDWKAAW